jgi:hypothetical protein
VGYPLKDVCASPVYSSESDEGSAEIMDAAYPQPEPPEIVVKLVPRVVTATHLLEPRRDDEVVWLGLVTHDLPPTIELPGCHHGGEGWIDRHLSASAALRALSVVGVGDDKTTEWLSVPVVVPPPESDEFTDSKSCQSS